MFKTRKAQLSEMHAARAAGDVGRYITLAERSVRRRPNDGELLIELSTALVESGERASEAARAANKAVANSSDFRVLIRAASMLVVVGRYNDAGVALRRLRSCGELPVLVANEASYLQGAVSGSQRDDAAAERAFRRAVAGDPQSPVYLAALARFLLSRDRRDEARALRDQVFDIEDESARNYALRQFGELGLA